MYITNLTLFIVIILISWKVVEGNFQTMNNLFYMKDNHRIFLSNMSSNMKLVT